MLDLPKGQLPAPSQGKRRASEPSASDDATNIDSQPAKRPRRESPDQDQAGAPRITSVKPVAGPPGPAPHSPWPVAPPSAPPSVSLPVRSQTSRAEFHGLSPARATTLKPAFEQVAADPRPKKTAQQAAVEFLQAVQDGTINFSASSLVSLLHRALFTRL